MVPHDVQEAVADGADVLIWTTESDEEQAALLRILSQIGQ